MTSPFNFSATSAALTTISWPHTHTSYLSQVMVSGTSWTILCMHQNMGCQHLLPPPVFLGPNCLVQNWTDSFSQVLQKLHIHQYRYHQYILTNWLILGHHWVNDWSHYQKALHWGRGYVRQYLQGMVWKGYNELQMCTRFNRNTLNHCYCHSLNIYMHTSAFTMNASMCCFCSL